ncbi:Non-specific serine/threonine protein kinase [Bertholletia excelsa]
MNINGIPKEKKSSLFSPGRRLPSTTTTGARKSNGGGCCRRLNDCMIAGTAVSHQRNHNSPHTSLEQQVAELEKEIQKQKEMRVLCRMRLERTQDYLRYCLQTAQENGFLDAVINNKDKEERCHPSSDIIIQTSLSPQTPPPPTHNSDLATLIDQAKINGWYIEPHEIEIHEKVAQGSTADIYKGTWRGVTVAVKCIYPDFFLSNESGVSFFAQEVETLSRQRHPYVLQLMGACLEPPEHGWVVTEFFSITLKEWLHGTGRRQQERTTPLPPLEERLNKALEIAQAMQYLHQHKPRILHRDLKPSNIFLDDALHVRVADFGHARFLSDEEKALTGETGTHVYMAPEVIRCEPYTEKCDVYSFGIILNELITGDHPYIETDYNPSRIAMEVAQGRLRPALPEDDDHLFKELINIIELAWGEDAARRPSFASITS